MADSLVWKKENVSHWVRYIQQRIKKNKNFIGFISGPTGSGKSWASLSIAEQVDPTFNESRIVFSGSELMRLINSGSIKSGSSIVFEETGIAMSNRQWQSSMNLMLNFLFQTFRHRNFILIMNSPYTDFIDSATRKLLHAEFQTVSIDRNKKTCKLKPQLIQYNGRMRKFYYKRLRVVTPMGTSPIDSWVVRKPSDKILKQYEPKKRAFTDKLNADITKTLSEFEERDEIRKSLTDIQQKVYDLLSEGHLVDEIATQMNISAKVVRDHMKLIRKKDYKITPIKDGARVIRYETG